MTSPKGQSLFYIALQKFKTNFWGVFSLCFIVCCGVIAVMAYVISPDNSSNANQMHLPIHSQSPGFKTLVIEVPKELAEESWFKTVFFGHEQLNEIIPIREYQVVDNEILLSPYDSSSAKITIPLDLYASEESLTSDYIYKKTFWLGTDRYGRDLLSRLVIGTRISISIGFVAVFISLFIGIVMGALSGYYGGIVDKIIMWIINVTWSIPTLLLVIALTFALGKGF